MLDTVALMGEVGSALRVSVAPWPTCRLAVSSSEKLAWTASPVMPVRTTNPVSPLVTVAVRPAIDAAGVGSEAVAGLVDVLELEEELLEEELLDEDELLEVPDDTVPPTGVLIDCTVPLDGDLSTVPSRDR